MARPIQKRNVYELVAERLMEDISAQRLRPGDAIPTERELTLLYGVGRSSVREGLRMLESHDVIRPASPSQYVVGDLGAAVGPSLRMLMALGHADLREITELRMILEVQAARLAAERRDEQDIERMEASVAEMEVALKTSFDDMLAADLEFHVAIARSTRNRAVIAVALGLRRLLEDVLRSGYQGQERAISDHRKIVAAIRSGNPNVAERRMREHLEWVMTITPEEQRRATEARKTSSTA